MSTVSRYSFTSVNVSQINGVGGGGGGGGGGEGEGKGKGGFYIFLNFFYTFGCFLWEKKNTPPQKNVVISRQNGEDCSPPPPLPSLSLALVLAAPDLLLGLQEHLKPLKLGHGCRELAASSSCPLLPPQHGHPQSCRSRLPSALSPLMASSSSCLERQT